jgi:LAO/AO transport system kinase
MIFNCALARMALRNHRFPAKAYAEGILKGDRLLLSRAITLVESRLPSDQTLAQEVLQQICLTVESQFEWYYRCAGVGKSSFIEVFGKHITSLQKKIAVLAVDPSSQITRGSIMGDKTRMETLSHDVLAFIRPSPTGNSLGGVTRSTGQAILLCEAAGYEVIIVETVGVGQSETAVHGMVDFFLLLMLANAGDELQGIKRGIIEMADAIVITKADGTNQQAAQVAKVTYQQRCICIPFHKKMASACAYLFICYKRRNYRNLDYVEKYVEQMHGNGFFVQNRQNQNLNAMHETIKQMLEEQFYNSAAVKALLPQIENIVKEGNLPAFSAALQLLNAYKNP